MDTITRTCCVTGHRKFAAGREDFIRAELRREILLAIEMGYHTFLSGFAEGVDLMFAATVVELKATHPIRLEAAIPYRGRLYTKDADFKRLIRCCDAVHVCSEEYHSGCFLARNRYMVERSTRVIAVFDGHERSGTAATIRNARNRGRTLRIIPI